MNISVARNDLLQAMQRCQSVVEKRHTVPILANLLLKADQEGLQITATDMEVGIRSHCPAEIKAAGATTVSARKLYEIIRCLDADAVVHMSCTEHKLSIQSGRFKTLLAALAADGFPELQEEPSAIQVHLSGAELAEMIGATAFAMSTDETRKYLTGTLFELAGAHLRLVTTDGHRLAMSETSLNIEDTIQCIVPRKAVHEIRKLCEGHDEQVTLAFGERQIRLIMGRELLVSKLIDARFPIYQEVIPQGNPNRAILPRQVFDQALGRSMIIADAVTHDLRLEFQPDKLHISAYNTDQEEVEEDVEIQYEGKPLTIGFNGRYLRDVLSVAHADAVCMEMNDELSPVLIFGEHDERSRYVIMPMRI
ncbi:MAG: DNA polymerase III subunit beta [Zetaproteobacteria bacterium]|nr:MAG: DNA polymerase III subunit beta [Zetaproteobacteria bacterium]